MSANVLDVGKLRSHHVNWNIPLWLHEGRFGKDLNFHKGDVVSYDFVSQVVDMCVRPFLYL